MRNIFILISAIMLCAACNAGEYEKNLDAREWKIHQKILSKEMAPGISTPYAIRFTKNSDTTPSCALIDLKDKNKITELVSPERNGSFPNCSSQIPDPAIFKIKEKYYAAYSYFVEDPGGVFTEFYYFINVTENGFSYCVNDELIDVYMEKFRRSEGFELAAKNAIRKYSCEEQRK